MENAPDARHVLVMLPLPPSQPVAHVMLAVHALPTVELSQAAGHAALVPDRAAGRVLLLQAGAGKGGRRAVGGVLSA